MSYENGQENRPTGIIRKNLNRLYGRLGKLQPPAQVEVVDLELLRLGYSRDEIAQQKERERKANILFGVGLLVAAASLAGIGIVENNPGVFSSQTPARVLESVLAYITAAALFVALYNADNPPPPPRRIK